MGELLHVQAVSTRQSDGYVAHARGPPAHTADAMSDDQYLDTMFADFRHGF